MHCRLLVTLDRSLAGTSEEAREVVYEMLSEDSSFIGSETVRFNSPVCDWFVIGGRWSGMLSGDFKSKRNNYLELGYEDDAQILTKRLYKKFIVEEWEGNEVYFSGEEIAEYVDLNSDGISLEYVDKKWLIVVDYHC